MNKIDLISIDLEGTLLDCKRQLAEKNRRAIQRAIENNIMIVISTGSPFELIPFRLLEGIEIAYAITANGSAVYDWKTKRCLLENCIEDGAAQSIIQYLVLRDIHIDLFIQGKGYCPENTKAIIDKLDVPKSRKDYLKTERIWIKDPFEYVKGNNLHIQKITMNFYPDKSGTLVDRERVREYLSARSEVCLTCGCYQNLEVTRAGIDKGAAFVQLCKKLSVSPENTMAIGDSMNDLSIIKAAGIGVAMSNAVPEVLEAADMIALGNDECGVAQIISKFMEEGS